MLLCKRLNGQKNLDSPAQLERFIGKVQIHRIMFLKGCKPLPPLFRNVCNGTAELFNLWTLVPVFKCFWNKKLL